MFMTKKILFVIPIINEGQCFSESDILNKNRPSSIYEPMNKKLYSNVSRETFIRDLPAIYCAKWQSFTWAFPVYPG